MRVHTETLHAAPPDRLVALRMEHDFLVDFCRRTGAVDQEVTVTPGAGGAGRTVTRRTVPTVDFPDVARRFVGETVQFVEEVEWDPPRTAGERTARYRMKAEGLPVTFDATVRLVEVPQGTRETVDGDVSAKVPLVGGRIEKAIVPAIEAGISEQAAVVREWLAR